MHQKIPVYVYNTVIIALIKIKLVLPEHSYLSYLSASVRRYFLFLVYYGHWQNLDCRSRNAWVLRNLGWKQLLYNANVQLYD